MLSEVDELLGQDGAGGLVAGLGGLFDLHLQLFLLSLQLGPVPRHIAVDLSQLAVIFPNLF